MAWSCCCCRIAGGIVSREAGPGGKGVVAASRACCCGGFSDDHSMPKCCRAVAMAWLTCACCRSASWERGEMAGAACTGAAAVRGRVTRDARSSMSRRLRAEAAALLLAVFACGRGCACVGPLCAATLSGIVLFPGGDAWRTPRIGSSGGVQRGNEWRTTRGNHDAQPDRTQTMPISGKKAARVPSYVSVTLR